MIVQRSTYKKAKVKRRRKLTYVGSLMSLIVHLFQNRPIKRVSAFYTNRGVIFENYEANYEAYYYQNCIILNETFTRRKKEGCEV